MQLRKFLQSFALWLVVLSALAGVVLTLQVGFGLRKFGGLEYVPRVVALSVVREKAAGAIFVAVLLAWVGVAHGADPPTVRAHFPRIAALSAIGGALALPLALLVAIVASAALSGVVFGTPLEQYGVAFDRTLVLGDFVFGWCSALVATAIAILVARLVLPWFAARAWRLSAKLLVTFVALTIMKSVFIWATRSSNP